jgi:hypothetical protein
MTTKGVDADLCNHQTLFFVPDDGNHLPTAGEQGWRLVGVLQRPQRVV